MNKKLGITVLLLLLLTFAFSLSANKYVTEQDRDSSNFWFNKGYALYKQKNYDEAISSFQKSIAFNPNSNGSYINWAVCLLGPQENREKGEILNEALEKLYIAERLSSGYLLTKQNILSVKALIAQYSQNKELFEEVITSFEALDEAFDDDEKSTYFYECWATTIMFNEKWYGSLEDKKDKIINLYLKSYMLDNSKGTYNLSCLYSLLNEKEKALMWLEERFIVKLPDREFLDNDLDFENIRDEEAYKELVEEYYGEDRGIDIAELKAANVIMVSDVEGEVDKEASFPGGDAALKQFINDNIINPEEVDKYGMEGRVRVFFIVDADGNIRNVRTSTSIFRNPKLAKPYHAEAKRLISIMPTWIPATKDGKAVSSVDRITIEF